MSANDLKIRNLDFIRQIPKIGARLFEAITDIKSGVSTMASQGNLNPNGDVPAPPNIQAVTATAANGVMTVSIQDQSAALNRDVQYVIEHADNPAFVNAQQRFIGATRSYSEFIGSATRYVRAYSTYGASSNSSHVYHGSATAPAPVAGGGFVGPPVYQPSQGAGTGAAGQSGYGQGPTQTRDQTNGFDWTLQRPQGGGGGFRGQGTPAGNSAFGTGGSGGGGGSPVIQPALYDTYANWTAAKYPPAQYPLNTTFAITNRNFVTYIIRSVAGSNKWVYEFGTYEAAYASKPTNGFDGVALGTNDAGLKFYDNTTYIRTWEWGGAAWKYASGELPGGDTSPAVIMLAGTTTPPGYAVCDGTAKTITKADATTVSFTTPPFTTGSFPKGGSYTGAPIAAVPPTISGHSELAATGDTIDTATANFVSTAGTTPALTSASIHTPAATHLHNLTSANAPIVQPSADPVPAVLMMFAVKL